MFNTTIIECQNLDLGPGLGTPKTTSSMMCKVLGWGVLGEEMDR